MRRSVESVADAANPPDSVGAKVNPLVVADGSEPKLKPPPPPPAALDDAEEPSPNENVVVEAATGALVPLKEKLLDAPNENVGGGVVGDA